MTRDELTPELLRAAIVSRGALLVRGLLDPSEAERLAGEIEQAFQAHEAHKEGGSPAEAYYEEFNPESGFQLGSRAWVNTASGLWATDSPRVMFSMLEAMDRAGLQRLATGYLGERPAISIEKCTLRRVNPDFLPGNNYSAWHQDGAFLGDVRALNDGSPCHAAATSRPGWTSCRSGSITSPRPVARERPSTGRSPSRWPRNAPVTWGSSARSSSPAT